MQPKIISMHRTASIIKFANRVDGELKKILEADIKAIKKIHHNIIGTINPEANITQLFIA